MPGEHKTLSLPLYAVCQVAQMNVAQLFDNGQDASAQWVVSVCSCD